MMTANNDIEDKAIALMRENDRGGYTVPTKGLYPFQWNWDSCLTALGFQHFDESRAWTEIETLFAHQWPDGMVPHIVFHVPDDGYFPGPAVWLTQRPVPTSGITQPPVAGFAVRRIFERARDKALARRQAAGLIGLIDRWHEWFYANRDPQGEGLVAIIHPWESGRDNSVDWDEALERVPIVGVTPYQRRDLDHADAAHRPTKEQYDRYLSLIACFKGLGWDNSKLHDASPFRVVDPGFNAILIRSCTDLAALAEELGETEIAARNRAYAQKGLAALETLWSDAHGQYLCRDRTTGTLIDSATVGGIIPAFAQVPAERVAALAERIGVLSQACNYPVPSHDPTDPRFDGRRYWRGPSWLIVNYMIADGLHSAGETATAEAIRKSSIDLINKSGFAEYYDPITAEPCGGGHFTWTAAMVVEFLQQKKRAA